jgi:hypothetical protein
LFNLYGEITVETPSTLAHDVSIRKAEKKD